MIFFEKQCNICQKIYKSVYKNSKFCSNKCSIKNIVIINKIKSRDKAVRFKFCLLCKKSFSMKRKNLETKYCSHRCSALANNSDRVIKCKRSKFSCLVCNKQTIRLYCSRSCKDKYYLDQWLLGKISVHTNYGGVNKKIKQYMLTLSNYKCTICNFSGTNKKTNNTILQIDHIDGNCLNGFKDNLRILCPNCHAMTENYGSLNKTSQRSWKRTGYALNKISR